MVWIVYVVRKTLDDLEQVGDEAVIDVQQILGPHSLAARHLVDQLQQKPMQSPVVVAPAIDQLDKAREATLVDHALEDAVVGATVEEEEIGNDMEGADLVLLKQ